MCKVMIKAGNNGAISDTVIARRKQKGLSQGDMVTLLKTKRRTYQRWESGDVSLKQLQSICSHLDLIMIILPKEQIEAAMTPKRANQ